MFRRWLCLPEMGTIKPILPRTLTYHSVLPSTRPGLSCTRPLGPISSSFPWKEVMYSSATSTCTVNSEPALGKRSRQPTACTPASRAQGQHGHGGTSTAELNTGFAKVCWG